MTNNNNEKMVYHEQEHQEIDNEQVSVTSNQEEIRNNQQGGYDPLPSFLKNSVGPDLSIPGLQDVGQSMESYHTYISFQKGFFPKWLIR